jgi:parvulin-like peptidyl-prolyl isomerase
MSTLVKVNGRNVDVASAIRLDIVQNGTLVRGAIDDALVRQYADEHGLGVSDQELQAAADEMRYQLGLEAADAFRQWVRENHATLLWVQDYLVGRLLRNKVRNTISDEEVEAYFAEHQLEFDAVELYSIRLDGEETARELYSQITEDGENFHLVAMEHSLDESSRNKGGYVGLMTRDQMSGEIEAAAFNGQPGDVIGPVKTERGYNLFKIGARQNATLAGARDEIRTRLFVALLNRLRKDATISYPILDDAAHSSAS